MVFREPNTKRSVPVKTQNVPVTARNEIKVILFVSRSQLSVFALVCSLL